MPPVAASTALRSASTASVLRHLAEPEHGGCDRRAHDSGRGPGHGDHVLGRSLGKAREPLKVAEEYALLDTLSGGRLIAGMPVGLSYDANQNGGIPPIETRFRAREGRALLEKAWSATEPFAWNGKYSRYPFVNIWPRPVPVADSRTRAGETAAPRDRADTDHLRQGGPRDAVDLRPGVRRADRRQPTRDPRTLRPYPGRRAARADVGAGRRVPALIHRHAVGV